MPTTNKILFWNAYNLFSGADSGWTHLVDKLWDEKMTTAKFNARVDALAAAVATFSGNVNGPEVLALAEVEMSGTTLNALTTRLNSALSTTYTLCARQIRNSRAICTCLLTRWTANSVKVISAKWRVLEISLTANSTDIIIFVCHWPSRISDPTGEERNAIADIIYDRVVALGSGARAIVLGDFNATPSEASVTTYLKAGNNSATAQASTHPNLVLYDLMNESSLAGSFTHSYQGTDEIIDHICCTGSLITPGDPHLDLSSIAIHTAGINNGGKPWRYDSDPPNGYSDHFPVSVDIVWS